jgi:hypothetical protein
MLTANKNITIVGQSTIDNTPCVFMSASISTDGTTSGSITSTISNSTIYEANKVECRKDMEDFQTMVYAAQDEIAQSNTSSGSTTA